MPRKKRFEMDKEPFITCIDRADSGDFELVGWYKTEEEALEDYKDWKRDMPDKKGRNVHVFKMIHTTGQSLGRTEK